MTPVHYKMSMAKNAYVHKHTYVGDIQKPVSRNITSVLCAYITVQIPLQEVEGMDCRDILLRFAAEGTGSKHYGVALGAVIMQ